MISTEKGRFALAALIVLGFAADDPDVAAPASSSAADGDVLFSRQLLEVEGLEVGDVVRISADPSGANAREFRIVAGYEPVPDPLRFSAKRLEARMHLPDLVSLAEDPNDPLSLESVGAINIALRDPADAPGFVRDFLVKMPQLAAVATAGSDESSAVFVVLERFHLAIALVTVAGSTAFLLALMVMRADERRETIGILRLIGFSRRRILLEVFVEGLLIAIVGALFGVLLASMTQGVANRFFQWRYDTTLVFVRVTGGIALRCIALAVPLGVLAGILASWGLLRREILSLLRR